MNTDDRMHSNDSNSRGTGRDGRVTRRGFVGRMLAGAGAGAAAAAGVTLPGATLRADAPPAPSLLTGAARATEACRIRVAAAQAYLTQPVAAHPSNGDETRYSNRIGSYSKGLPHNPLGEVDPVAYNAYLKAVGSGKPQDFAAIPMGAPGGRGLVSPLAGLSYELEGADAASFYVRPAPAFASAERAGEMVENYWMALLRDVPFTEYNRSDLALAAANDLSRLSDFRGLRGMFGKVTPDTLFRNITPGDAMGPYLSQFFYHPMPIGASYIEGRMQTLAPNIDFMTNYDEWLQIQRGYEPSQAAVFDPVRRYPRNGRDISQWVHMDLLYQAYFQAMCCLLAPASDDPHMNGMEAPFDPNNPYLASANQDGFVTFGAPHIATLLCEVANRCMKAQWYQKWFVHRTLRPEAYAGRVHNHLNGKATYPIGADLLNSPVLKLIRQLNQYRNQDTLSTYLLPMTFPEGSPLHPSFGSGHATVAGACVTILKAWFDENWVIPNPVQPTPDGLGLEPYRGGWQLTVGGELNKLASNISFGRNIAGVHWRSDAIEAMKLGEAVAISILRDQRALYGETFNGWSLTKFDGTKVVI